MDGSIDWRWECGAQGLGYLMFTALCLARHYYTQYPNSTARRAALWANLYSQPNSPSAAPSQNGASDALLPLGVVDQKADGEAAAGSASVSGTPTTVTPTATAVSSDTPTGGDEHKADPLEPADWSFTLMAAFVCSILTLIGYVVEQVRVAVCACGCEHSCASSDLCFVCLCPQYATYA
jgi:hypothetical protein